MLLSLIIRWIDTNCEQCAPPVKYYQYRDWTEELNLYTIQSNNSHKTHCYICIIYTSRQIVFFSYLSRIYIYGGGTGRGSGGGGTRMKKRSASAKVY